MSANRLGCPSLALAAFLMVGSGPYAGAQPLGINPSAAPSNIGNPSSINPAAGASDIRNPSAINPAAAASQIPRSSVVSPTRPTQAMPRVARQRIAQPPRRARAVQRTPRGPATACRSSNDGHVWCQVVRRGVDRALCSTLDQEAEVELFRDRGREGQGRGRGSTQGLGRQDEKVDERHLRRLLNQAPYLASVARSSRLSRRAVRHLAPLHSKPEHVHRKAQPRRVSSRSEPEHVPLP